MKRSHVRATATALCAFAALAITDSAEACGGCFVQPDQNTVVSGHRMALAISKTETVLWDQIQYSGNPSDFAWVLPVKQGARIEESTDAWFDTLEAGTQTLVNAPPLDCGTPDDGGGFGCGAQEALSARAADDESGGGGTGVTVVHQGSVGPYETVTLSSADPAALLMWLADHGYAIDADFEPVVDAYVSEGFDFIALRLQPGNDVSQMTPVRVVSPGASPTLPLRMVAAGTGAFVPIVLYVIGEGRWEPQNFPATSFDPRAITFDFNAADSDFETIRARAFDTGDGDAWLTASAQRQGLVSFTQGVLQVDEGFFGTIADAYLAQAPGGASCFVSDDNRTTTSLVVGCDPMAGCQTPGAGEISADVFRCGTFDDLAVAMTGKHPADVWLTRLEANLPRSALATDLVLQAATSQEPVSRSVTAGKAVNAPCRVVGQPPPEWFAASVSGQTSSSRGSKTTTFLAGLGLAAVSLLARRRRGGQRGGQAGRG